MPSTARAACINLNGQADIYDPQKRYVRRGTGILPVHTLYIWGSSFELDASCSFLLSLISKENAFSPTTQSFTASLSLLGGRGKGEGGIAIVQS